ncbi:MAG TPA: NAD(P)H-dependent glycerol-3-phosphate dehydrogenase [Sphingomicrobium sp.]|nr:NAD(P)H-dependent glycerol-3-phosphate dehydrogenase [Sphingomicrobium sp.]
MTIDRLAVIGGGAWGTALAQVAAGAGRPTLLWVLEPEVAESVNSAHENRLYLSGVPLSPVIQCTNDLADLESCDAWLVVTPAQHMRTVLEKAPHRGRPLVLCSKGIEERSGQMLHHVAAEVCPEAPIAVISGPTFAHEVAAGLPTAVTLACEDHELAEALRERISLPTFRIYLSDDVTGAEIGGAVKNVLAIACGVVEGRHLGLNARAALIARGFAEMTRFGLALGAKAETLTGMSGLGDLVLTCTSTNSRNFSLGKGIAEGRSVSELMSDRRTVAEGAFTAPVLRRLATGHGIDMPIVNAVDDMLAGRSSVEEVLERLLTRPLRAEGR